MNTLASVTFACGLAALTSSNPRGDAPEKPLQLRTFTVCLVVKDVQVSTAFCEKPDFKEVSGDVKKLHVVMQSGTTRIALFQGLLERTTLTFNPGTNYAR